MYDCGIRKQRIFRHSAKQNASWNRLYTAIVLKNEKKNTEKHFPETGKRLTPAQTFEGRIGNTKKYHLEYSATHTRVI